VAFVFWRQVTQIVIPCRTGALSDSWATAYVLQYMLA